MRQVFLENVSSFSLKMRQIMFQFLHSPVKRTQSLHKHTAAIAEALSTVFHSLPRNAHTMQTPFFLTTLHNWLEQVQVRLDWIGCVTHQIRILW